MTAPKRIPLNDGQKFGHNPFTGLSSEGLPAPETPPADSTPLAEAKPAKKNPGE